MTDESKEEIAKLRRILSMVDRKEFTKLFFAEVKADREKNLNFPMHEIFDRLNEEYFTFTGKYRFSDYDSFRHFFKKGPHEI